MASLAADRTYFVIRTIDYGWVLGRGETRNKTIVRDRDSLVNMPIDAEAAIVGVDSLEEDVGAVVDLVDVAIDMNGILIAGLRDPGIVTALGSAAWVVVGIDLPLTDA